MENTTLIIRQESGKISCNYEEVKRALLDRLSEYKDAFFSEESKNTAKAIVAELRKEKKAAAEILKEKKEAYMEPWNAVEKQVKELIGLYDEPIGLIDGQIKAYEEQRKEAKRKVIRELYETCVADVKEFIPLEKIYDPRWENATMTEKTIQEVLKNMAENVRRDVESIRSMGSDAVPRALELYKKDLRLTDAIAYVNQYERQRLEIQQKEQERRRREEEERVRREEREKIEAEERTQRALEEAARRAEEEKQAAIEQAKKEGMERARAEARLAAAPDEPARPFSEEEESELPFEQPSTLTAFYKVVATHEELEEVEMAFTSIGIYFERRFANGGN